MPSFFSHPSIIILMAVLAVVAIRQVIPARVGIWQVMLAGAVLAVAAGDITVPAALRAVNLDVMLFLFGMFIVGEALVASGALYEISGRFFDRVRSPSVLVVTVFAVMGAFSALLMNDTVAIIGTPLVLYLAKRHNVSHKLMLLSLCFATTLGSAASPIGNPQNLLIAIGGGVKNPFVTFMKYLGAPTLINIALAYVLLRIFYGREFGKSGAEAEREGCKDPLLSLLSRVSLALIGALITLKVLAVTLGNGLDFRLSYIAVISAMPVILFSPRRLDVVKNIDWTTLVFFASMFVLMESVWNTGALQGFIRGYGLDPGSTGTILVLSVAASQLLSNVPYVALYLPVLNHAGTGPLPMLALAAGSTIAGNLFILGAASNVIIIQNAEKRGHTLSFTDFAKIGVPLTILNTLVYWLFL